MGFLYMKHYNGKGGMYVYIYYIYIRLAVSYGMSMVSVLEKTDNDLLLLE